MSKPRAPRLNHVAMSMAADALQAYAVLGVHRVVVNLGSQKPERVDERMAEIGKLVKMAA